MADMPHGLPEPKRIEIVMRGTKGEATYKVDASILPAGSGHPWSSREKAVIVLKGGEQARDALAARENQAAVRAQMVKQLADRLTRPEVMNAELITLGAQVKKPRVLS
jgi:hypothetical protein